MPGVKLCPEDHLIGCVNTIGGPHYEIRCGMTVIADKQMDPRDGDVDMQAKQWMQTTMRAHNLTWLVKVGLTNRPRGVKQWCLERIGDLLGFDVPDHEAGTAP